MNDNLIRDEAKQMVEISENANGLFLMNEFHL
jgi:hypothetical protein